MVRVPSATPVAFDAAGVRTPAVAISETQLCHARGWPTVRTALLDTFDAYDDDGKRYVVHVRRSYINTGDLSGPGRIEGLPSYQLKGGGTLNRIDDETFEIIATGKCLKVRA